MTSDGQEQVRRRTAQLRATAHPVRLRILSLLTGAPMSAAEVARELALTHANASYHLRRLHAAGAVVLAEEATVRGGRAKRYRYDVEADLAESRRRHAEAAAAGRPGDVVTGPGHALLTTAMADELRRRAAQMAPRPDAWLSDAELWVDPATWADVTARIGAATLDLHRAARRPRTPGTVRVNATVALFGMEPDGVPDTPAGTAADPDQAAGA